MHPVSTKEGARRIKLYAALFPVVLLTINRMVSYPVQRFIHLPPRIQKENRGRVLNSKTQLHHLLQKNWNWTHNTDCSKIQSHPRPLPFLPLHLGNTHTETQLTLKREKNIGTLGLPEVQRSATIRLKASKLAPPAADPGTRKRSAWAAAAIAPIPPPATKP